MKTIDDAVHVLRDLAEISDAGALQANLTTLADELQGHVWVRADHLFGIGDLAELFFEAEQATEGKYFGRTNVTGWAARQGDFPLPVARLKSGPVYDVTDVVRWWMSWVPMKGRKSGSLSDDALALYGGAR